MSISMDVANTVHAEINYLVSAFRLRALNADCNENGLRYMPDPNFPPNLDIRPLTLSSDQDDWQQQEAIQRYGIAGRIWEATELLIQYFTPGSTFDPPCSLLSHDGHQTPRRIVELGSGQSVASLHLASYLHKDDTLILTDLPEVVPLCEQSLAVKRGVLKPEIVAAPLAWGASSAHLKRYRPFTHILLCDLIYFPELYPSLLYTLLDLTETHEYEPRDEETIGPELIVAYKPRTLALEHSFFDAFGLYFRMTPIIGGDSDVKLYTCQRWRVTDDWEMPTVDTVMNGAPGVVKGRDFGYIDQMFASMEW